jgi:hypothetical protein
MEHFLLQLFIYLTAAVIAVPIAKRLGLDAVLGYLIAGMIIGPSGLALIGEIEAVMHFTEFGIVMMLFLVGLELKPSLLLKMRVRILGMGGMQVALSSLIIGGIAFLFLPWQMALAVGIILALSSTAIVLQTLQERGIMNTSGGRSIFSVLLFQDLAVIPILAILPFLATFSIESNKSYDSALYNISGYKVISSMGAGGKFDPMQVKVADISKTHNCNLARMLRKRLYKLGVRKGFKAIFSPELIDKSKVIIDEGQNKKSVVGTISYMPPVFGCHCAAALIKDILDS